MKAIERLYKYIDYKGNKPTRFEKELGLSNGYLGTQLKRNADLGESVLNKIVDYCLDINPEWLLTGEGEMLKSDIQKTGKRKLIPVYDTSTIGGNNELIANTDAATQPAEWIDGGDWFSEATSAIHHYGDSMIEYPSGCILALKRINDIQMIIWGKNYVVETDEYRITKRLQRGLSEGYIRAYSTNEETYQDGTLIHQPIDILLSSIKRLELVLGYVVKEQSSGKIYNIINKRT
jgi:hypothetical protein